MMSTTTNTHPPSPAPPRPTSTDREAARLARVARVLEIRDAAITREALGQAAHHRRLPHGQHEVSFYDRPAGVLRTYTGATLEEAIGRAQDGRAE